MEAGAAPLGNMYILSHWQPPVSWIAAAKCPGCSKVPQPYNHIIEGSLDARPPAEWTDGKAQPGRK